MDQHKNIYIGIKIFILTACLLSIVGSAKSSEKIIHPDKIVYSESGLSKITNDLIIYTAHQSFDSRVYLMLKNGSVQTYYEYFNYRFVDVEIVNNEVYLSEAFAPRVYKFDVASGDLEVFIDDWSLYYFYGIAFDGTYFYLDEWDLNRYDIYGNKDGTAAFDESIMGSAWDGSYYWTLDEENHIKCWDISEWPTITEITENAFAPPTPDCRGLWYDGESFWTAEATEGAAGKIYQFDYSGTIMKQWDEPTISGWSACLLKGNSPPEQPSQPIPTDLAIDIDINTSLSWYCYDEDNDSILYDIYFGTDSSPSVVSDSHSNTTYQPTITLDYQQLYYWKIDAFDNNGGTALGPIWSFTTEDYFLCGNVNSDETVNIFDITFLIAYLYQGGSTPAVLKAADVDASGEINIFDITYLISYLYWGGPEPTCI